MDEPKPDKKVIRTYDKGEIIFEEGSPGQEMYEIAAVAVKVTTLKNGRDTLLNRLEVGEFFGEMALVDGAPRSGKAIADEDGTRLVALDLGDFLLHNYHDSPEEGWKMSFNKFPQAGLLTYCDEIQERGYYGTIHVGKSGFVKICDLIYEKNSMTCKLHYDGGQIYSETICAELNQKAENVKKGWKETTRSGRQTFYLQGDVEKVDESSLTDQYLLLG